MLTITERDNRKFCDGLSRRAFLRIGGLGAAGLSLPQILASQQASAQSSRPNNKSVIMVYLPGGPPHQDMFDLKPDAPSEVRGEFNPIKTNVPGIQICELLPRMAGMMDKLAPIRSIVGANGAHYAFQCMTGRNSRGPQPPGGWPELGSVLAKLKHSDHSSTGAQKLPGVPPYVNLAPVMQHKPYNNGNPGFLGTGCAPFRPLAEGKADLTLKDISLNRLNDRRSLLKSLDHFRRDADNNRAIHGADIFTQQAFGILTSSKLANALNVEKEDKATRDRYGYGTKRHQGDGAPAISQQFLAARRLVEAGVPCVTLSYGFWDWHGSNFKRAKQNLPWLDMAVTALVSDLHARGLDKDVSVIVWGEFGRTPKINKNAGRDHWPKVSCALMAGGGMKTGQAIGKTDRIAGEATDRPVHFQEVFATLYHQMGINPHQTTIQDFSGRPHYLVDRQYQPIKELI